MATLATGFGPLPAMASFAVGYGAGTADVADRANVVQVVLGTATGRDPAVGDAGSGTEVTLLEVNVDDVTGEVLAHTVAALMAAGAHDAWLTPIVMKKGRPAHVVSVLCDPAAAVSTRELLLRHTGSLGVRASTRRRWPQRRNMSSVEVDGQRIGIKRSEHRVKVEFEDAARAAETLGLPVRVILERAIAAASSDPDEIGQGSEFADS
jgi:pyridinium-3,5-bisthiocarboxylic acid mononucleotide nickel chelatase